MTTCALRFGLGFAIVGLAVGACSDDGVLAEGADDAQGTSGSDAGAVSTGGTFTTTGGGTQGTGPATSGDPSSGETAEPTSATGRDGGSGSDDGFATSDETSGRDDTTDDDDTTGEATGGTTTDGLGCSDNEGCDLGDYCVFPDEMCGEGVLGTCHEIGGDICPGVYMPVCGCDGSTYGNSCEAAAAGVDVAHDGGCDE
jgi:hypothetical protein